MSLGLIVLAVLPSLVVSYYVFHLSGYDKAKVLPLGLCFVLGVLITVPALQFQEYLEGLGIGDTHTLWHTLLTAFVGVALNEEMSKSLCVFIYPFHRPFFNTVLDGILCAVMVGMGFATLENIIYANSFGYETVLIRSFTAIPAHAIFGVIIGYYIGVAKLKKKQRALTIFKGLLLAVLLHGIYDFFLLQEMFENLMGFSLLTLFLGVRIAKGLIIKSK